MSSIREHSVREKSIRESDNANEKIKDTYEKYSVMGEGELFGQLRQIIDAKKQSGEYSEEELLNTINTLSPFISPSQLVNIKKILKEL